VVAEIAAACDGAEALEYLLGQGRYAGRDTHRPPSFILLDIKLPKLSERDVLRSVRSNPLTALVPVVILTPSSERSDMEACYQSGANGFVGKPVDFGELTEKLDRLQAYRLGVNKSIASV
jgi:two-component system response regulator